MWCHTFLRQSRSRCITRILLREHGICASSTQEKILSQTLRVQTLPGFVPLLRRELLGMGIRSNACMIEGATALVVSTDGTSPSLHNLASRLLIKSRLLNSLTVRLCPPFEAKWEKQIRDELSKVPWSGFFPKSSRSPEVYIKAMSSRLTDSKRIEGIIRESFHGWHDDGMTSQFDFTPCNHALASQVPVSSIKGYIVSDMMEIHADLGGKHPNEIHLENYGEKSRLKLTTTMASAVAVTVLDSLLTSHRVKLNIWDPFVGDGSLCMAFAAILNGIPPRSPTQTYPVKLLPCFDDSNFEKSMSGLQVEAHRTSGSISSIIGTDSSYEAISTAETNRSRFAERMPPHGDTQTFSGVPVGFQRVPDVFMPPQTKEKLLIVTALPGGGDFEKRIRHFHLMAEKLRSDNRLGGAFVLTNKSHSFKKLSPHSRWLVDLRFLDGNRREVELLRLV